VGLVIRRRSWERHQNAGQTPGAQLGYRDHPRPGDDQLSHSVSVGHRVEEVDHLHPGRPVVGGELGVGAAPGDPEHNTIESRPRPEPRGHRPVERQRALAAARHQDHSIAGADSKSRQSGRSALGGRRGDRVTGLEDLGAGPEPE
jgi:hypothetical protein